MAIKDIIDFSTFTDPGTAFDLFSNSIRRSFTFDSYGGKTKFQAVVLTNPIPVSPNDLKYFISNQSGSSEKISQFVYRARIVGENSPHQFIPDPCDPQYAGNQEESYKIIEMHTLFVSNEEESNGASLPRINSLVEVELEKNVFGYNLGHGKHIGIVTNQDRLSKPTLSCDSVQSILEDGEASSLEDITNGKPIDVSNISARSFNKSAAISFIDRLKKHPAFKGYSLSALAGVAANASAESNFDFQAAGDKRVAGAAERSIAYKAGKYDGKYCSFGFFQLNVCGQGAEGMLIAKDNGWMGDDGVWKAEGQKSFISWLQDNDGDNQLTYVGKRLKDLGLPVDTNSAYDFGEQMTIKFEKPQNKEIKGIERGKTAKKILEAYNKEKDGSGGSA